MIEIGVQHNGGADLPVVRAADGTPVCDCTLEEMHESYQRVLAAQVRQGVLAEEQKEMAIVGGAEEVTEGIIFLFLLRRLEFVDACLICHFEMVGYRAEEIEYQMQLFSDSVMPSLRAEFGGSPEFGAASG